MENEWIVLIFIDAEPIKTIACFRSFPHISRVKVSITGHERPLHATTNTLWGRSRRYWPHNIWRRIQREAKEFSIWTWPLRWKYIALVVYTCNHTSTSRGQKTQFEDHCLNLNRRLTVDIVYVIRRIVARIACLQSEAILNSIRLSWNASLIDPGSNIQMDQLVQKHIVLAPGNMKSCRFVFIRDAIDCKTCFPSRLRWESEEAGAENNDLGPTHPNSAWEAKCRVGTIFNRGDLERGMKASEIPVTDKNGVLLDTGNHRAWNSHLREGVDLIYHSAGSDVFKNTVDQRCIVDVFEEGIVRRACDVWSLGVG